MVIENPHGLHARPAAKLVQFISRFQSDVQLTNQTSHKGPSSGRSLSSVSLLQARRGDSIRFSVRGSDSDAASAQLKQLAAARFGEAAEEAPAPAELPVARSVADGVSGGVGASEGIAIGRVLAMDAALPMPKEGEPGTPAEELDRLSKALAQVGEHLKGEASHRGAAAEIFAAQALILSDPVFLDAVHGRISGDKVSAARAWRVESEKLAASWAGMEDEYLRARAADVRDIATRVLRVLLDSNQTARIQPDPPAILLTTELLPSEAIACDPKYVLGVVATAGSATAHAAILMRTLGIPMVVGASGIADATLGADAVLAIDGATGEVWVDPPEPQLAMIRARQQALLQERAALEGAKREPAITLDHERIEILANVGNTADALQAMDNGAEGVGLLRTEFVYLANKEMPSEDQQTASLAAVLKELGPGPVVIRTPDVGADKPLAYLEAAEEHNPFLGVRGLRLSFRYPEFFRSNLKAILRAGEAGDDGRGSGGGRAGRAFCPAGGFFQHRHQRPDAVCDGHRARQCGPGLFAGHRASGRAAHRSLHLSGGGRGILPCIRLRRCSIRSCSGGLAGRGGYSLPECASQPGCRHQGPSAQIFLRGAADTGRRRNEAGQQRGSPQAGVRILAERNLGDPKNGGKILTDLCRRRL